MSPLRGRHRRPLQIELLETRELLSGTWTPLTSLAPSPIGTMMLLSDGRVMAQQGNLSKVWYQLLPNSSGSYLNGTWSSLASMSLERLYTGSNVLPSGKVFVLGGEYSGTSFTANWINSGEIYDPVTNSWSSIPNFPQSQFGDDPTIVLPNGKVLAGYLSGPQTYLYAPASNSWSFAANKMRDDRSDEETWLMLPDGSILSYDIFSSISLGVGHAQRYVPSTNTWVDTGTVPVSLSSSSLGYELGPAFLLPDGRAFQIGANSNTAFYTPSANTWAAGPITPNGKGSDDAPGTMLPNGHVIYTADTPLFNGPTQIFDFDPVANTITQVTTPPGLTNLLNAPAYIGRMLMLPSGQMLLTTGNSSQLWVYTPTEPPSDAWRPIVTGVVNNGGGMYTLTGTQLTGISEGASYGDDAEMSTNYPIVQLTNTAGSVFFARTFNWTPGVATGGTSVTTQFTLPTGLPLGVYTLKVIANGISSAPFTFSTLSGPVLTAAGSAITSESIVPNDGALDPGETVTVNLSLSNVGTVDTTNLVATLLATGGVASPSAAQTYGVVVAGAPAVTRPFTFTGANGITCGSIVTATLHLQDGTTDLGMVPFTFQCGVIGAIVSATSSTGNISTPIPDVSTVDIPLTVSDTGLITDVDVKIRLNHTWDEDLDIFLVHPDGTTVELSTDNGLDGDNYGSGANDCSGTPTVFDDSATTAITAGTAPFANTFRPEGLLSALNGKPANGTWKLRITDDFSGDVGTIGCFQLVISGQPTACVAAWDGGGSTNNWSEAANWLGDVVPQSADNLVFSATSAKNSTLDAAFAGTIGRLRFDTGYTGTLTLGRSLSVGSVVGNVGAVALGSNTLTTGADNTHTTFSGAISGSGALTKAGTGSFYLRGNSSYDGATTINDGSILVSANNALGTATGGTTVAAGTSARLVFERSVNYTAAEPVTINGSGFNAIGSLVGVGNSSFAGSITLGSASTIGTYPVGYTFTVSGSVQTGGNALTVTGPGTTVMSGMVSGSGSLTKTGPGTLTLSNTSSYAGGTTVAAGTLLVTGSITTSAATVNSGAVLGGTGTVGATTANGGTVSPGAPGFGILSESAGNFSSAGILRIQVQGYGTPGSSFDRLNLMSGLLTAGGTSKLSLDLAGLSSTGTASGVVLFGSRSGAFTTVELVNNPNHYSACPTYGGSSLDVTIQTDTCPPVPSGPDNPEGMGVPEAPPVTGDALAAGAPPVTIAGLDPGPDSVTDPNSDAFMGGGNSLLTWSDGRDYGYGHVDDLIGWDYGNGESDPLGDSSRSTQAAGVVVPAVPRMEVLPVGFPDSSMVGSPADLLVVTATGPKRRLAQFSDRHPEIVDVAAPSAEPISAMPGGGYAAQSELSISTALVPHVADGSRSAMYRTQLVDAVLGGAAQASRLAGAPDGHALSSPAAAAADSHYSSPGRDEVARRRVDSDSTTPSVPALLSHLLQGKLVRRANTLGGSLTDLWGDGM